MRGVLTRLRALLRKEQPEPVTASDRGFMRSVYGPELAVTAGDKTFQFCVEGYDTGLVDRTIQALDQEFLFLDIGANLGLFSLLADRHRLCRRVVAFEPLPEVFANLQANLERNEALKVTPVCAAVTNTAKHHVYLSFDPSHSGMSRVLSRRRKGSVRARTVGPSLLNELVGNWRGPVVAKIDVEGSEVDVLRALRETDFYRSVQTVIIEISERNLGAAGRTDLLSFLAADGFRLNEREGPDDHYDAHYQRADHR